MGTGKKIDVKKPGIRRVEMVKHSDSPRRKLEIPLIPKTEHVGTFPPSLLGTSAGPWSPTMPSPQPRSLPASASASSGIQLCFYLAFLSFVFLLILVFVKEFYTVFVRAGDVPVS